MIKYIKEILSFYKIRNVYFTKFQAVLQNGIIFSGGGGGLGGELKKKFFPRQKE